MRKSLIAAVAVIVAALAMPAIGQADDVQSITANLSPAKRSKKKFKPAKIYVEILTQDSGQGTLPEQPPSATNTKVNFPKNARFNPKAVPRCKASEAQLQNTTTDQAKSLCGTKSIVSKGSGVPSDPPGANHATGTSAWVYVQVVPGPGGGGFGVPVEVTAFNGNKKNTLFLHSRADSVNNTSVLVGKLKTGKKAPKGYGSQLDVTIPPLAAGAIARFTTTVKSGKYVQARCKVKKEKWQAITKFSNYSPSTVSDDYVSKCKQK
jgi:hypothetical protein